MSSAQEANKKSKRSDPAATKTVRFDEGDDSAAESSDVKPSITVPEEAMDTEPTEDNVQVFVLMHHAHYDADVEAPGTLRLTDCWAAFATFEAAVEGLQNLVRKFKPDGADDAEDYLRETELETIVDIYGKERGDGYRYRTDGVCEQVMWVEVMEVR